MDKKNRGLLVFINNIFFDDQEKFPDRIGASNDKPRLEELFQKYHYEVKEFNKENINKNVSY